MAHRSRLAGFIIDCEDADIGAAADFWSAALGLAIVDRDVEGAGRYAELGAGPGGLHIEVQNVDHPSRVQLDIEADDIDAEAARLEALGARRIGFAKRWWLMAPPRGQRFCIVRMKDANAGPTPNAWPWRLAGARTRAPANRRRRDRSGRAVPRFVGSALADRALPKLKSSRTRCMMRGCVSSIHPHRRISPAMSSTLFTSESVSEGHPDKVADQISDAVLDAILAQDKRARVACETMVKTGVAIVAGEVTTSAWIDLEALTRKVIVDIGYDSSDVGFDGATCGVLNLIGKQSPDINQGVDRRKPEEQGAGDQGLMFGYATNETDSFMPAAIHLSHRLVEQQAKVRKKRNSPLPWLRPDAKSQVTLRYENGKAVAIDAVVLSTQHDPSVKQRDLVEAVREYILKPVLPTRWLHKGTKYHINPTGKFVIGGPVGDCGLTGRKIIVDTYGGWARHGGGAFSGKDPSKVDRSAAYAARYVAKNIVAAGIADRCEVQVSYAIGVAHPTSISSTTFGTGRIDDDKIEKLIRAHFDLRPYGILKMLDLVHPMYQPTAAYGHFGRAPYEMKLDNGETFTAFSWEKTDKAAELRKAAGLK